MEITELSLEKVKAILAFEVYGNSAFDWIFALGVTLVVWFALHGLRRFGLTRIRALAERLHVRAVAVIETLQRTQTLILFLVAIYAGMLWLVLPDRVEFFVRSIVMLALFVQVGLWLVALLEAWLEHFRAQNLTENAAAVTSMSAVGFILKLVLWAAILLLALENLGVDITALIAGLGIGGIAVALAAQNILGDLFASLTIVLDKPFVVGDFLILDEYLGTVERVGLKTTRLRSLSGELLIFSNNDLLSGRIRNYGRMYERRVLFGLGVIYQTPREKLQRIPGLLREAVEAQDQVRFDRAHFKEYGDFSLDFEVVYYVMAPDYNLYMDIQQAINFGIHERFEAEGIEFAYPTRTVFLAREDREDREDREERGEAAGAERTGGE